MGFKKAPSAPAVTTVIPVVSETPSDDTRREHDQSAARRKGLLSTILSRRQPEPQSTQGNTTLG